MILPLGSDVAKTARVTADIINSGGVAVAPTDTVYGFLASALNEKAIEHIYAVKGRERNKPFLVLLPGTDAVRTFSSMQIPERIRAHIPGALTFIMPLKPAIELSFAERTLAMRIPKHPFLEQLLALTGPLVAPSANPAGNGVIREIAKLIALYEHTVDIIVDAGDTADETPSTIFDCMTGAVVREGAVKL
ncbi:MAG: threonylcarbamoyl-AMP synthase [Spirochaetes bacterium]|nr:threonylcarbamoyl-AMP synthase [Spirochaetota bacterium]